jgi:peptide/nickel transport system ATP-binding protein
MSQNRHDGEAALVVENVSITLDGDHGASTIVDDVSFSLPAASSLGIVGESGCGKSMTALSILGLLPRRISVSSGSIRVAGKELAGRTERELQDVRGREVGMVFQDPMSSLNPALSIGKQLIETIRRHTDASKSEARDRSVELLTEVGIANGLKRLGDFPHQLSGGMRQRVMIAIALSCDPSLLIADEPTTALDLTVQASILRLLARLREERGLALLLISHDLGMLAQMVDEVVVMYAGQVVEMAPTRDLFASPEHPYTEALLGLLPNLGDANLRHGRFQTLSGQPPQPAQMGEGCRFSQRCPYAKTMSPCDPSSLRLREIAPRHWVRSDHARDDRHRLQGVRNG